MKTSTTLKFIDLTDLSRSDDPAFPRYVSLRVEGDRFTLLGNLPHATQFRPRNRESLEQFIAVLQDMLENWPDDPTQEVNT